MSEKSRLDRFLERGAWCATILAGCVALLSSVLALLPYVPGLNAPSFIPEILGTTNPGDLGECAPSMEVAIREFCEYEVAARLSGTFRVERGGAYPPGQSSLKKDAIKVDWDQFNYTFQAIRLDGDSATWRIEVTGEWEEVGDGPHCAVGDELSPGQFCVESKTGAPFRVYATDQLYEGDARVPYVEGYAVLFHRPEEIAPNPDSPRLNDKVVKHEESSFRAERIAGTKMWRIVSVAEDEN